MSEVRDLVCEESVLARHLILQDLSPRRMRTSHHAPTAVDSADAAVVKSEATLVRDIHVVEVLGVVMHIQTWTRVDDSQPGVGSDERFVFDMIWNRAQFQLYMRHLGSGSHTVNMSFQKPLVDMTADDSDHEVPGPLRGNRFVLWKRSQ